MGSVMNINNVLVYNVIITLKERSIKNWMLEWVFIWVTYIGFFKLSLYYNKLQLYFITKLFWCLENLLLSALPQLWPINT